MGHLLWRYAVTTTLMPGPGVAEARRHYSHNLKEPKKMEYRMLRRPTSSEYAVFLYYIFKAPYLLHFHGTAHKDRVFRDKSPAMAAGITDKIWSVLDLLWFRPLCQ